MRYNCASRKHEFETVFLMHKFLIGATTSQVLRLKSLAGMAELGEGRVSWSTAPRATNRQAMQGLQRKTQQIGATTSQVG